MNIGVIVPCYNEEAVLDETAARLTALLDQLIKKGKISKMSKIWFIDDGSNDRTWHIIERLSASNGYISGIKLSRNVGHQNALLAGLSTVDGDALASVDADLQDDIVCIEKMIDEWRGGAEIVYGVRKKRNTDTVFKRLTALTFYKLMRWMGVEVVFNHADFRLMSRRAIECLKEFREINLFIRGIVPLIGFKSSVVYYERNERFAGESKYPLKKMLAFALDGITSFSVVPLRMITFIGFMVFTVSTLMSGWVIIIKWFGERAVPGWASTVLPMYFIGGIQILCIGIIGEYLGKIYTEVKDRPRYIIEKII
jgi:glycosyltransferase involved in cell wall biosynthesis